MKIMAEKHMAFVSSRYLELGPRYREHLTESKDVICALIMAEKHMAFVSSRYLELGPRYREHLNESKDVICALLIERPNIFGTCPTVSFTR